MPTIFERHAAIRFRFRKEETPQRRKVSHYAERRSVRERQKQRRIEDLKNALLLEWGNHRARPDGLRGVWQLPKSERADCGAKCRDGHACKAKVVPGKTRCRLHGGLSTGAKTEAGRAAIVASNQRRSKSLSQTAT